MLFLYNLNSILGPKKIVDIVKPIMAVFAFWAMVKAVFAAVNEGFNLKESA